MTSFRAVGGVVNTAVVMAVDEGIITAKNRSLLVKYGGHMELTKEVLQHFLAHIQAEVVVSEVLKDLILNSDKTALQQVPSGR